MLDVSGACHRQKRYRKAFFPVSISWLASVLAGQRFVWGGERFLMMMNGYRGGLCITSVHFSFAFFGVNEVIGT